MNPYLKLEQPLIDLKTMAGLLEHMATSDRRPTGQELGHISDVLKGCHEDISTVGDALNLDWPVIPEATQHEAEIAGLKAEIEACKASHAPPGSEADVKSAKTCWWLLARAARTVLDEAEKVATHEAGGGASTDDNAAMQH